METEQEHKDREKYDQAAKAEVAIRVRDAGHELIVGLGYTICDEQGNQVPEDDAIEKIFEAAGIQTLVRNRMVLQDRLGLQKKTGDKSGN